jgi:hypothetical protein
MGVLGFTSQVALSGLKPNSWVVQEVRWWEYGLYPDCKQVTWEWAYIREAFRTDADGNLADGARWTYSRPSEVNPRGEALPNMGGESSIDDQGRLIDLVNTCPLCEFMHIRVVKFWSGCDVVQKFDPRGSYAEFERRSRGEGCLHEKYDSPLFGRHCSGPPRAYAIRFYWNICPCDPTVPPEPRPPPSDAPAPPPAPPPLPPGQPPITVEEIRRRMRRPVVVTSPPGALGGVTLIPGAADSAQQPQVTPIQPVGKIPGTPSPTGTTHEPRPGELPGGPQWPGRPTGPTGPGPGGPFFPPSFPYPPDSRPPSED